ncbi:MAG TPA: GDP-L-fucose synthase [Limnobacter sp.]|uniref:GDP-L-fucose synthase family protein n=1 Tax=Limnobacter sp. TaxID=2003368 RepID=UPI002EDACC3A
MKILITGANGMVGKNIRESLEQAGGHTLITPGRTELDLQNKAAVEAFMLQHQPNLVIHCAGRVGGIQANMAHPVEFLVENLDMGRNVIMAAHGAGVPKLLNMASSCMYPAQAQSPLAEDLILAGALEPTNEGYAIAKIVSTRLCEYITRTHADRQYKTMVPCNLYGRHDKFDPKHSHLIPAIIHKVWQAKVNGEPTVEIWGDGTARREFMYAGDVADAVMHAIGHFDAMPVVVNIGLGDDHTVNDYYATVARVMGWQGTFVHDLSKPVGMKRKMVDVSRQTAWGWKPAHSLEEGLKKTIEFYLEKVSA